MKRNTHDPTKLEPHLLIHDEEVPSLIRNEEHGEASIARRQDKAVNRQRRNRATRFIAEVAAGATLVAGVAINEIHRGNESAGSDHPDVVKIYNADGKQGAVKFVPWEMATEAQRNQAIYEQTGQFPEK